MELVNLPEVVAEVAAVLERYEDALMNNKVDVLDELFWDDPRTVRLGAGENLYGIEAIRQFRNARPTAGLARTVVRTEITTFGHDFAVTHREFTRAGNPKPGRQTQTLVRSSRGWRIVSAHISNLG
jgi:hypothetical protein